MILYGIVGFIILLIFLIALTDKYNPALQFHIITGFGFLFLYDETETEDGLQVIYQLMLGIVLISISYTRND